MSGTTQNNQEKSPDTIAPASAGMRTFVIIWIGQVISIVGIGLIYVLSGVLVILISALAYLNPRIRRLEQEVPDAVPG